MEYVFCARVHDAPGLKDSFNALTRRVYGFDFSAWDAEGLRSGPEDADK